MLNLKNFKLIIHLSHTDLDGYGSQYLTHNIVKNKNIKIKFFNTEYSKIESYLKIIIKNLKKEKNIKKKEILLIITDLSFNEKQFKLLIKKLKKYKLLFIDHHKTTINNLNKLNKNIKNLKNWEFVLDTKYCATKLTFKYFKEQINKKNKYISNLINIYDLWKQKNKKFFKSVFFSNLIFMNFPLFKKEKRLLNFYLIKNIGSLLKKYNVRILEKDLNNIIYKFLDNQFKEEIKEINNYYGMSINNFDIKTLTSILQYNNILKNSIKIKENMYIMKNTSPDILQYGILYLFKKKPEIILINYYKKNKYNKLSIRSQNNKAIKIAELFNGGGHINSAGAVTNLKFKEIIKKLKDNYI